MSDTTPRPDETPSDPTAPAQPPAEPSYAPPAPEPTFAQPEYPPPAPPQQPYAQPEQPYAQPQQPYAQPQLPPPAYAGAPGTAVAGPNPMSPTEERTWGMLSHGAALAATVISGGTLSFVAALVMYLIVRDRGPFVRAQAASSLNIQIIASIGFVVSVMLMFVLIGFITYPIIWVAAVVLHVIGMIKSNNGEWWSPPLTPQFVK